jgi:hypothetical protein
MNDDLVVKGKYNTNGSTSWGALWQANEVLNIGITG